MTKEQFKEKLLEKRLNLKDLGIEKIIKAEVGKV